MGNDTAGQGPLGQARKLRRAGAWPHILHRKGRLRALAVAALAASLISGCGWFGFGKAAAPENAAATNAEDPFADGVLRVTVAKAPPGSDTQALASIADQLGWEPQLQQNALLRQAIVSGQFEQRVLPFLLSLFYRNGYSVLPTVGDGHQVNRDSIIRGVAGENRILISTRDVVRIIFLGQVKNVQVIYPQDGKEPQVFTVEGGVVAVRKSFSELFLR